MKSKKTRIIKEEGKVVGYFIDKEDLQTFNFLIEFIVNSCNLPRVSKDYLLSFLKEWKENE